jgi:hypothetical protein
VGGDEDVTGTEFRAQNFIDEALLGLPLNNDVKSNQ